MALPLLNNFETGPAGATVSSANSGGPDANAFDGVTIGTNMAATYDNTVSMHGGQSMKIALAAAATAATTAKWTSTSWGAGLAHFQFAIYVRTNVASIASSVRLISFYSGATLVGRLGMVNGNQGFQFRNSADATTSMGAVSGAISANTFYRVEVDVVCGASGTGQCNVYVGDSTTLQGSTSFTGQAFGTVVDEIRFGPDTANFSSTAGDAIWFDGIATSAGLPLGPRTRARRRSRPRDARTRRLASARSSRARGALAHTILRESATPGPLGERRDLRTCSARTASRSSTAALRRAAHPAPRQGRHQPRAREGRARRRPATRC
jgi:hypothetical protein